MNMSEDENGESSNPGLFGTAFIALIGAVLIYAQARSGQSLFETGSLLLYGIGAIMIGAPITRYYFQLKGIDIDIGRRIGIDHLKGANAIGSIEVNDGHFHLHQEAMTENEQPDYDKFEFSQDFGLWESGDYRAPPLRLERGQRLSGYVSAHDDVSVHILTIRNYNLFEEDEEFKVEWYTEKGTYLQIDFTPTKPGRYYFLVTNIDDLEDFELEGDHDEDEEKVQVKVRLNSRQRRNA